MHSALYSCVCVHMWVCDGLWAGAHVYVFVCAEWNPKDLVIGLHLMNLYSANIIFTVNEAGLQKKSLKFSFDPDPQCNQFSSAHFGSDNKNLKDEKPQQ